MLLASDLPKFLWTESVQHTVWLKNCTTTHALDGQTPFEIMFKMKPNLKNIPEWGACIFILCKGCSKFKSRADEACWVGYSLDSKGHRVYWPKE